MVMATSVWPASGAERGGVVVLHWWEEEEVERQEDPLAGGRHRVLLRLAPMRPSRREGRASTSGAWTLPVARRASRGCTLQTGGGGASDKGHLDG